MTEAAFGLLALLVLLALFLTGIELAFAMGIIGFLGFALLNGFDPAVSLLANDFLDSLASYGLTAIPLFVLMGQIAFNAGIAKSLYDANHKFLGHIPGGLAVATVRGATVFKAICGSVVATSATFASVAIPEMDRYGYSRKLSTE
jgi:TRAP-type mannitol/chloroaromatic compound transport system permease large subunit